MHRRRYLLLTGVTVGLAGCTGDGDDGQDDQGNENIDGELRSFLDFKEHQNLWLDEQAETFSEDASDHTDAFELTDGLAIVVFGHTSPERFEIDVLQDDEPYHDGELVSEHGSGTGAVTFEAEAGEYALEISGDGSWNVIVAQPKSPNEYIVDPPTSGAGDGNQVIGPLRIDGQVSISANNEDIGIDPFVVTLAGEEGENYEVIFDEDTGFEGETTVSVEDWVGWIDVVAERSWEIELEME